MKKNKLIIIVIVIALLLFLIGGIVMFINNNKKSETSKFANLDVMIIDSSFGDESTNVSVGIKNTGSEAIDINGLELVFRNRAGEAVTSLTIDGMENDLGSGEFTQINSSFPSSLGKITEVIIKQ